MEVDGATIPIYDKERMIIELLRNKNKMPKDLYKEVMGDYRRIWDLAHSGILRYFPKV